MVWEGKRVGGGPVGVTWHQSFKLASFQPRVTKQPVQVKWKDPTEGWVKINVDGAIRLVHNLGGVGVVIRDWNGRFIAVGA